MSATRNFNALFFPKRCGYLQATVVSGGRDSKYMDNYYLLAFAKQAKLKQSYHHCHGNLPALQFGLY